jgi:hypothetical protein
MKEISKIDYLRFVSTTTTFHPFGPLNDPQYEGCATGNILTSVLPIPLYGQQ